MSSTCITERRVLRKPGAIFMLLVHTFTLSSAVHAAPQMRAASGTKKISSAIAFKLRKADKSKFGNKSVKYCYLKNSKWLPAIAYGNGKATPPSSVVKKDNTRCKQISNKVSGGAVTIGSTSAINSLSQIGKLSSGCTTYRVASDGTVYSICVPLSDAVIYELPNLYKIIEPVNKPTDIAGVSCYYGLIAPSGAISCLDALRNITVSDASSSSTSVLGERMFQSDSADNVFFMGSSSATSSGRTIYKLSAAGVLSAFFTPSDTDTFITAFTVLSDDGLVVTGRIVDQGSGDTAPSLTIISSSGTPNELVADTRTISGLGLSFLKKFPDGKPYVGLTNYFSGQSTAATSTTRIMRLDSAGTGLENFLSASSASPVGLSFDSFCSGAPDSLDPFCDYGGTLISSGHATSSKYLAVSQGVGIPASRVLVQYSPSLQTLSLTNVPEPRFVGGYLDDVYVSGGDGAGGYKLVHYDPDSAVETVITTGINFMTPLLYAKGANALVGYGSRISDLATVFIQIPITTSGPGTAVTNAVPLSAGLTSITLGF